MNTPLQLLKDPVDELLKADAAALRDAYVDDDGFTLAVMDRLPARRPLPGWLRAGIPAVLAALAAIFAFGFAGGGNFMIDASMDVATGSPTRAAFGFAALVAILVGMALQMRPRN